MLTSFAVEMATGTGAFVSLAALSALVGFVAGIVGLIRTRSGRRRGHAPAAWGTFLCGGVLLLGVPLMSMGRAREPVKRVVCASNLRQIGQSARQYAIDHGGAFPPDLETLLVNSDFVARSFVCPSSEHAPAPPPPPFVLGSNCSYIYVGTGRHDDGSRGAVLAFELPTNHNADGANVLFADGTVRFLTPAEYGPLLAAPLAAGR